MFERNKRGQFVKGYISPMIGKKRPDMVGDKNFAKRIEVRKKISDKRSGQKLGKQTLEHIEKRKNILKMKFNITNAVKERWKNHVPIKRRPYFHQQNSKYIKWRNDIFKRDNWTCQNKDCNKNKCYLEAHHIKSWTKYPELRYELSNGITLCKDCHKLTRK